MFSGSRESGRSRPHPHLMLRDGPPHIAGIDELPPPTRRMKARQHLQGRSFLIQRQRINIVATVLHLELARFMSAAIPGRMVLTFHPILAVNRAQPQTKIGVRGSMAMCTAAAILLTFPRISQSMSPRTAESSAAQQQRMHSNGSNPAHRPAEVQAHAQATFLTM